MEVENSIEKKEGDCNKHKETTEMYQRNAIICEWVNQLHILFHSMRSFLIWIGLPCNDTSILKILHM